MRELKGGSTNALLMGRQKDLPSMEGYDRQAGSKVMIQIVAGEEAS